VARETILKLDEEKLERFVDDLCLVDREIFTENAWVRENFERPLPNKFDLSMIALHTGKLVGYLIASTYGPGYAHVHRFVVVSDLRRKGLGTKLLLRFEDACLKSSLSNITLESLVDRYEANGFYERMGFKRISSEDLVRYVDLKGKTEIAHTFSPNGKVIVYNKQLVTP
jgi:ribosomal protein S18 acetylase RimI-like enzyme